MSAGEDERPGHATRRPVIAGVLVPRGVRAGTDAGRTRATEGPWPSPNFLHPKSDGPYFRFREKWRRSGFENREQRGALVHAGTCETASRSLLKGNYSGPLAKR